MYYVLDDSFVPIMPFENYVSFLWTDRFFEAGDFEIETMPETALLEQCKQDYYILNTESEHEMIIEGLKITTDAEEGTRLYITGSSLESILKRRIVWSKTLLSGNLQNGIKKILDENIISPTDKTRKIPNFVFQESTDEAITKLELVRECDKENIYDLVTDICKTKEIGFKIVRNEKNEFVFSLYAGKDHSYAQGVLPFVAFSPKFDNLENSEFNNSTEDSVNTVYVTGGENDSESLVVGNYTGLLRRESYVNAGTIEEGYTGSYTDFLTEKGNEELKDRKVTKIFEGDVDATGLFKLGVDFSLGDIVQIENEFQIQDRVRVIEIIHSDDESGHTVYPTFEAYEEIGEETV